jgi:hypothetical protein
VAGIKAKRAQMRAVRVYKGFIQQIYPKKPVWGSVYQGEPAVLLLEKI